MSKDTASKADMLAAVRVIEQITPLFEVIAYPAHAVCQRLSMFKEERSSYSEAMEDGVGRDTSRDRSVCLKIRCFQFLGDHQ